MQSNEEKIEMKKCFCGNGISFNREELEKGTITKCQKCGRRWNARICIELIIEPSWDEKCKTCELYQCWYSEEICHPRLNHPCYESKKESMKKPIGPFKLESDYYFQRCKDCACLVHKKSRFYYAEYCKRFKKNIFEIPTCDKWASYLDDEVKCGE